MHSQLKSTTPVLALVAVLVGLSACAKYPVVVNAAATAPSAATTPAPAR